MKSRKLITLFRKDKADEFLGIHIFTDGEIQIENDSIFTKDGAEHICLPLNQYNIKIETLK